ncbi:FUT7 (predicted) [Pycnogonum litorale]
MPVKLKPSHQIWILYLLESPRNTPDFKSLPPGSINWTASYRHDSDIVTPYEKFQQFEADDPKRIQAERFNAAHNYAQNKTKMVAWFVSNCGSRRRIQYAQELSKYIQVDIYGVCGTLSCMRDGSGRCFHMLNTHYKFYLAFENSECRDYITEKFFVNGLGNDVIPIVMGARPEDYRRQSPPKSHIHVDDYESPQHLAEYLHKLDQNDELFNQYFQWKGTGEFINTYFWCRLCAMLNAPSQHIKPQAHHNVNGWWRGHGVCGYTKRPHRDHRSNDKDDEKVLHPDTS